MRLQAFGVTEPTSGTDTTRIRTFAERQGDTFIVNGQKIWICRAEHSDLMVLLVRTTPREEVAKPTDGMSVLLVDMKQALGKGLTIRPIRTMLNHATTELFFDDLEVPAENLIGEVDKGFRYIIDGMNAERILIAAECIGDGRFFIDRASAYAKERSVFGKPIGENQAIQFPIARAYVQVTGGGGDGRQGGGHVRRRQALRQRGQHVQAAGLRSLVVCRRYVHPDPWRLRLCRGIRYRAQIPRDAPLSGRTDLDQSDPQPCGDACAGPAEIVLTMDIDHLKSWVGRTEEAEDHADAGRIAELAATLDHAAPPWIDGEAPPLAHWLWFHTHMRQSELGPDGHPKRGGFLPPVELPRRMWAGSRIRFLAPVPVGSALRQLSTIRSVEAKSGKSGAMIFVTVSHEIFANGTRAVIDEQDIVYRQAARPGSAPPPVQPDTRNCDVTRTIHPDPVLLFRYSALIFNGHRIHYDRDYCRDVEGYPGLVVHGPLTATLLMDHFLRARPGARVVSFAFRAQRPLFDIAPFDVCLAETAGGAEIWARNPAGEVAVTSVLETA